MIIRHNSHIVAYMVYLLNKPLTVSQIQNIYDLKLSNFKWEV